jgi:hypothetical protein
MKRSKRSDKSLHTAGRARLFGAGVVACVLLAAGAATAVSKYGSRAAARTGSGSAVAASADRDGDGFVTVEVGGKRMRVNARTLQQGPLTPEQSRQVADALEGNKSTAGLVEVRHEDGTASVDLQGRFRNVTVAKRNEDGPVSTSCVDTPEAAEAFLQGDAKKTGGAGDGGKSTAQAR